MQSNSDNPLADQQDVLSALVALGCLPTRQTDQAELDLAAYRVALDGVLRGDLASAVRAILQGALGHGFFPSPPDLRLQCNAIRKARADEAEREARRQRLSEERAAFRPVHHTPEQRARIKAIHQEWRARWEAGKSEAETLAEIMAKYDPRLLEAIPDREESGEWQRPVPRSVVTPPKSMMRPPKSMMGGGVESSARTKAADRPPSNREIFYLIREVPGV